MVISVKCFVPRYVHRPWKQLLEAIGVAIMSTVVAFILIYFITDCQALGKDPSKHPLQVGAKTTCLTIAIYTLMVAIFNFSFCHPQTIVVINYLPNSFKFAMMRLVAVCHLYIPVSFKVIR